MSLAAVLFLVVTLAPPFGDAEARAVEAGSNLVLEVYVDVAGGPVAVLARGVGIAGELEPTALTEVEPGRWAGIVTMIGVENIRLAFEALYADGRSETSEASTLIRLGVDPVVFSPEPPRPAATSSGFSVDPWLVVAIVAGALALVLVVLWAFAGRPAESTDVDTLSENADNMVEADNSGRDRDEPGDTGDD